MHKQLRASIQVGCDHTPVPTRQRRINYTPVEGNYSQLVCVGVITCPCLIPMTKDATAIWFASDIRMVKK